MYPLLLWTLLGSMIPQPARADEAERAPNQTMTVGFGALWFAGEDLRPVGHATPLWGLRYGWQAHPIFAVELAWLTHTSLERSHGRLQLDNLIETDLKLTLSPHLPLLPFVAVGLGYGAWSGGPETTDPVTWTLPLMAGLEVLRGDTVVQARGTWRQVFMDETNFSERGADHLALTLEFGNRF